MKKLFVVYLLILLCLGACQMEDMFGTAVITLPGGSSARSSQISGEFMETLSYRIICERQGDDTVIREGISGGTVSISLAVGDWSITVIVLNAAGIEIGKGTVSATIKAGPNPIDAVDIIIKTDRNEITYFEITSPVTAIGQIDQENRRITVAVPPGTNVTNMQFSVIHEGVKIDPAPGTPVDFSSENSVEFTVTAENDDPKTYIVVVTGAYLPEQTRKDISIFKIIRPVTAFGVIDNESIIVTVPYLTPRNEMEFEITHNGVSVDPDEGPLDFNSEQTFTVIADNGSTKTYTVKVNYALSHFNEIHNFEINSTYEGEITGDKIILTVPYGTNLESVTFSASCSGGALIDPPVGSQIDLREPKQITVTASNGLTKIWTVTVEFVEDTLPQLGTPDRPFRIYTEAQLKDVGSGENGWTLDAFYKLMEDIILSPDAVLGNSNWTPIGSSNVNFTGTFDGNNKVISNLYINNNTSGQGMFGFIGDEGVVKNLELENLNIYTNAGTAGGIAANNFGLIKNCSVKGNINSVGNDVGGIAGNMSGADSAKVENCHSSVIINGNTGNYIGGVVGRLRSGKVINSYSVKNISGRDYVGGVVGITENTGAFIENCYAEGNVSGNNIVGGLAGRINYSTMKNCYAEGNVSGRESVGGVVGINSESIMQNCYAIGNVSASNNFIGGVAGSISGSSAIIENCYAKGNVSGYDYIGGVAGYVSNSLLQYCYASGIIIGTLDTGGIAGGLASNGIIRNCVAINEKVSGGRIGRILGAANGIRTDNYARSDMDIVKTLSIGTSTNDGANVDVWNKAFWDARGFSGPWWDAHLIFGAAE